MKILRKIWKWINATHLRKLLSSVLVVLILITSIRFLFLKPKLAYADSTLGFDEGYGSTVTDNNLTLSGTITNAVWKNEEYCKVGKCLYFDGTGDLVNFGNDSDVNFTTGSFTIEGWFRTPDITSGTRVLIAKYNGATGTDGGYKVYMDSNGYLIFGIDNDQTGFPLNTASTSTSAFDDNLWHFFTAVKNGTTSISIYVDGTLYQTTSSITTSSLTNTDSFYVGIDGNGSSNGFSGFLDEIKVYSTSARSSTEIKADYTGETTSRGTSASFGPDTSYLSSGLVGYWKMDENTGTTATDFSGNGNTMTFGNSPSWGTGNFGSGVTMNGTNSYLTSTSVKDSLKIRTHSLSAFMWEKVNKSVSTDRILLYDGAGNSTDAGFILQPDHTTGIMQFWISDGSSYIVNNLTGTSDILDGKWHFVGFTWNPKDGAKLFADGKLEASVSINTNSDINSTNATYIGGFNTSGFTSNGIVDETRFYNRALSPAEVSKLYSWAPGPVGWWKLDENSETTANDSSGSGNGGTLTGIKTWGPGKFGSAINTQTNTGVQDIVTVTDPASGVFDFNQNQSFTFSTWVKSTSSEGTLIPLYKGGTSASDTGYDIEISSSGNNAKCHYTDGTNSDSANGSTTFRNDGLWHLITCVVDRTGNVMGAVGMYIFLDGKLDGSLTTLAATGSSANSTNLQMGEGFSASNEFTGSVDDVKIYNYARSVSQIVEDMNGSHPAPGSPVGSAIGHWKFDEGVDNTCSGGTNDACNTGSSGTTLDGSESGMAVPATSTSGWTNNGKFGKALSFDGTNDYVQVTDSSDLDITGDFTLSAWVARAGGTNGYIISKTNASTDGGYALLHGNSGEVYCRTSNGSGYVDSYTGTGYVNSDSAWHHLVAVRNGTSCHVWIDGKDRTSTFATHSSMTANSNNLRFGARPDGASDWFNGKIDEVQIFNSALTSGQILALYNQGSQTTLGVTSTDSSGNANSSAQREYCPPGNTEGNCGSGDPSPIGEWKMDDDNRTTTAIDTSGNGNNGTISNQGDTIWVPGVHGSAVNFDITANTKMDMGNPTVFNNLSALTADIWIYPRSAGDNNEGRFFDKTASTGPNTGWYFKFTNSSRTMQFKVDCGTAGGDANDLTLESVETLPLNSWSHIALTWDGNANPTGHARMYINGRETTYTGATSCVGGRVTETTSNLKIGNQQGSNQRTFDGYMEEARLYNYVRTPAQIAWDYNKGKPVAWYKFDECTGSTAFNSAPYGNSIAAGMNATIVIGATGTQTGTGTCSTVDTATSWYNGRNGKYNAGFSTDATNDYAYVADTTAIDFTSDMTVSGWVNTATLPSTAVKNIEIVNKYLTSTNQRAYRLFVDNADNKYYFYTDGDGASGGTMICASTSTITTGVWHFVAGTFTGSSGTIYVDGRQEGTCSAGFSTIFNGSEDLVIGMDANKTSAPDAAIYDDIRLYNYALSAKQIQLLYNEGAAVRFGP